MYIFFEFQVYVVSNGDVKRTVLWIIERPIREIGIESSELLNLVTERTAPSPELVNKVRDLYISIRYRPNFS